MGSSSAAFHYIRVSTYGLLGLQLLLLGCPLPESGDGIDIEAVTETSEGESMLTETGEDPTSATGDGDSGTQETSGFDEAVLIDLGPGSECGDATVQDGEQCDQWNLAYESCIHLGYVGGTLACHDDCTFDVSGCISAGCGNGYLDTAELCDGSLYPCWLLGYAGGGEDGMAPCLPTCMPDATACDPACVLGTPGCFCWGVGDCPSGYECEPSSWGPEAPGTCEPIACSPPSGQCGTFPGGMCCNGMTCINGACQ